MSSRKENRTAEGRTWSRVRPFRRGLLLPALLLPLSVLSAEEAPRSPFQLQLPSPVNDLEREIDYPIDGTIENRYRLRLKSNAFASDQDMFQNLYLRAGDPTKNKVSGVFHGRLSEDIDGGSTGGDPDDHDPFQEITDTYKNNVNGRFYLGYIDFRRFGWMDRAGLDLIRGGRQVFDESAEVFVFDGGRIDTKPFEKLLNLRLTAYGGLPVHYYESSPRGDALAGAGAEASPFRRTRARVDWTYVQDRLDSGREENQLISLALWQGLGEKFDLHARYNLLDGKSRDYLVRGTFVEPAWDLLLQAAFHQSLETIRRESTELDPFYWILQEYQPFLEVDLHASKGLGSHFVLDGGLALRELLQDSDEGTFNHEFQRYYLTPAARDWPFEGMSLSLTGELWDEESDLITTLGGEVSQRFLKVFTGSFGSYYSLYKVDYLSGSERTHDRTFFWRVEYFLAKDLKLTGLYELERDDISTYHTVEVRLQYSF